MDTTTRTRTASGWMAELRATLTLAWPLVVAQVAQNALFTTDVVMMGWLGPQYLAAGTLATAFLTPFLLLGGGIVSAVAPLAAQALGGKKIRNVRRTVRQGFWVAILLAALLMPVVWQIGPVLHATGQDPELVDLATLYMHIAVVGLLPGLGLFAIRGFLSVVGATRVLLVVTLGGVLVNALFNYLFMFGNFGFPRLELRGAAITTVVSHTLMFLAMITYALTHRRYRRFHLLARFWKPDWPRFREIFRIGTPIGLSIMAEVGMFAVAALLMGRLGTDQLAAHAVAAQLASIAFMVPLGVGSAATVRVGLAFGARDSQRVHVAGWISIAIGTGFMAMTCLLFVSFPGVLSGLFLDQADPANTAARAYAATFLAVAGLFQIIDGAQVVGAHVLRGLNDTKTPMLIALVGYWVIGIPTAAYLGAPGRLEGVGVWLGLASGLSFCAVAMITRFALREKLGLLDPKRMVAPA